ncbi:MAG: FG-GAP-like repeat-containing protein, partial [Anaerolineae bacterium]
MQIKRFPLVILALGLTGLFVTISLAAPGNPDPNPASNTHTAPLTTTVSLTYDEPISATTVTSHTFAVHAIQTGLLTTTHGVANAGQTIVVTPTHALRPGELVQTTATTRTLNVTAEQPANYTVWQFRASTQGGSGVFVPHATSPTFGGGNSLDIALGDVDGDGDLDVLVANAGNQPQDVYLNDGSGAFSAHSVSPTFGGGRSESVALGDVDGDGDLDALVANYGAAQVVRLNDGTGRFISHPLTSTFGDAAGLSRDIALGDVDGDGDLDAVIANDGNQAQEIHLNDGTGRFVPHPTAHTFGGGQSSAIALGDVDDDGDLDALVANAINQSQVVYRNDGTGRFTPHATFGGGNSRDIDLGDVDGDGDLDTLVANLLAPQEVYLNDGDGNFASSHTFGSAGFSYAIALGDVDDDGDLDALVANYSGQPQEVYLNDGSGVFDVAPITSTFGAGDSYAIALGDVDGDGDLDALIAQDGAAQTVWLNRNRVIKVAPRPNSHNAARAASPAITVNGVISQTTVNTQTVFIHGGSQGYLSGTFALTSSSVSGVASYSVIVFDPHDDLYPGALVQASVTDDVLDDGSIPINPYVWQFRVATVGGSGAFAAHPLSPTFGAGLSYALALGDVDGDGYLDILVANGGSAQDVYLNDKTGRFAPHPSSPIFGGGNSRDIALGDVDSDGDLDALVANYVAGQDVYLNDGSGGFSPHPSSPTFGGGLSHALVLGDVDGDGDLDTLVANEGAEQDVYLNDGIGRFTAHPVSPTFGAAGSSSRDVVLGDVDADGDLDALVANYNQPQNVYLNDGTGRFAAHPISPTFGGGLSYALVLGDADGDGDLDALVANYAQSQDVYLNDGKGGFSSHPSAPTFGDGTSLSRDVTLGDVDGDGDLDALIANDGLAQEVYLNDGRGRFVPHPRVPTFDEGASYAAALGDIDGDGDLDALVANFVSDRTVWLNGNRVIGVDPAANSYDATRATYLTITTNGAISQTSVTTRTILVHGGFRGSLGGTFTTTSSGTNHSNIVFDPDGDLHPGELVQTSVTTGVLDGDGTAIAPYVWQFRAAVGGGSGVYAAPPLSPTLGADESSQDVVLGDVDGDGD